MVCVLTFVSSVSLVVVPQAIQLVAPQAFALLIQQPPPPRGGGAIRGRVELTHVAQTTERRPGVADLGAPLDRDLPDRRKSVVYL
jgi:hypothetical protein